jgi:ABC-type phosphate transport system auxiliary subunit
MLSKAKFSLTRGFFETVASRVKHVYDVANSEVEIWLRSVMSPLESRVREHHLQLQRQLESAKRIHVASGELEARIGELERQHEALAAQIAALMRLVDSIDRIVESRNTTPIAANV